MTGRWWPWLLLVLALIPALLINQPKQPIATVASQTENVAIFGNPGTLDPAVATSSSEWAVDTNVFASLFRLGPNGAVEPNLVSHYTMAGNLITLTIRPVALTGGGHLTANIVASALARPLWPKVHSLVASNLLESVRGSQAVVLGKTLFLSGVSVVNKDTVTLRLKKPATALFLKNLANPVLSIVPASDLIRGGANWQLTNLYGTGGWRLSDWVPNGYLTFNLVNKAGPNQIILTIYPTFAQAVLSFRNQAVNLVPVQPQQIVRVPRADRSKIRALPVPGNLSLFYHTSHGVSRYANLSIAHWIAKSFSGRISGLGGHWPGVLPVGKKMTLYVNEDQPESVQLATTLRQLRPHKVVVQKVSALALKTLAQSGQIGAYIGQVDWFKAGISVPLVPLRSLWLVDPNIKHVSVYANGSLDWHSLTVRP